MGRKFEFKFRNADGVKYDTFFEAQQARDKFIKDNNIKFKEKNHNIELTIFKLMQYLIYLLLVH